MEGQEGAAGGGGTGTEGQQPPAGTGHFFDTLPDDLKTYPGLAKFKTDDPKESFASALRSYVNLEKMKGNMVSIPDEKTDPAIAKEFWAKVGVPAEAAGYDPPALPEGYQADQGLVEGFNKVALEAKIPKSAAKKLMDWYIQQDVQHQQDLQKGYQEEMSKAMDGLRQKWGAAADHNVALAQQVVADIGVPGLKEALEETGAGNNPAIIEFLAKVGKFLSEDSIITAP